jgi:hypothetical protein
MRLGDMKGQVIIGGEKKLPQYHDQFPIAGH